MCVGCDWFRQQQQQDGRVAELLRYEQLICKRACHLPCAHCKMRLLLVIPPDEMRNRRERSALTYEKERTLDQLLQELKHEYQR